MKRLKDLLIEYGNKTNIDVTKEYLSEKEGKTVFSLIVSDFQKGKLSFDNLSSLCEQAYNKFDYSDILCTLLIDGANLEWDIRNNPINAFFTIEALYEYFNVEVDEDIEPSKSIEIYAKHTGIDISKDRISNNSAYQLFRPIITSFVEHELTINKLASLCRSIYKKLDEDSIMYEHLYRCSTLDIDISREPFPAAEAIKNFLDLYQKEADIKKD